MVKEDWCGACKHLKSLVDELNIADQLTMVSADQAMKNAAYSRLVNQAYGFYGKNQVGSIPLVLKVRRGRITKADAHLGSFKDANGLRLFLQ
jgi:hypothetical protein